MHSSHQKGFTLIELLVVISIVGLLSSVVLAALSGARNKAKDSAVIQEARQVATLMALEYSDSSSYANLQRGWIISDTVSCNPASAFAGNYAGKITELCNSIKNKLGSSGNRFYVGAPATGGAQSYSIMVVMPSTGNTYFCIGDSGRTSLGPYNGTPTIWYSPGCYGDP